MIINKEGLMNKEDIKKAYDEDMLLNSTNFDEWTSRL